MTEGLEMRKLLALMVLLCGAAGANALQQKPEQWCVVAYTKPPDSTTKPAELFLSSDGSYYTLKIEGQPDEILRGDSLPESGWMGPDNSEYLVLNVREYIFRRCYDGRLPEPAAPQDGNAASADAAVTQKWCSKDGVTLTEIVHAEADSTYLLYGMRVLVTRESGTNGIDVIEDDDKFFTPCGTFCEGDDLLTVEDGRFYLNGKRIEKSTLDDETREFSWYYDERVFRACGEGSGFVQINQNYATAIVELTAQPGPNKPVLALFDRATGKTTTYSLPNWSSTTGPAALMAVSGAMVAYDDKAVSFSRMEKYSTKLRTNLYAPANVQKKFSWLSMRDGAEMEKVIQQLGFSPIQSKKTDWTASWSSMTDILNDQNRNPFKSP